MTARRTLVIAVLLCACGTASAGEPPLERRVVQAVADLDLDRILVRWALVDGDEGRFTHYDVLRREFDQTSLAPINLDPIGPLTTVAEIETLFTQAGFADALADIQAAFGTAYASKLLAIQQPSASDLELLQRLMLPDQNYGAAIALGLGLMDDSVVNGTTYVYEVWGLDALGFRQERLGRAVATAGAPDPLPQADAECAELGDTRADMRTFVRWSHPTAADNRYIPGYDLYRVAADSGGLCSNPNGPAAPGAVKVNPFPTQRVPVGNVTRGAGLFTMHCSSCHTAADPRNVPPPSGVLGGTISSFERRVHPELWPIAAAAAHDTTELRALSPDTVRAVFDWIHEFHYVDDGSNTPAEPLIEGDTFCYQVLPRDLLGQYGGAGAQAACDVVDRDPPQVPWKVDVQRVVIDGTHEVCEVSWERNADPGDDTVDYLVYRMSPDPPRASSDPTQRVFAPDPYDPLTYPPLGVVPQPPGGDRMTYQDISQDPFDAEQRFFYAVAARDDANGISAFSGWSPCVPRDIAPPPAPVISVNCCDPVPGSGCHDLRDDPTWLALGGEPIIIWDATLNADCIRIDAPHPPDTFGMRLYRSLDGSSYLEGRDFKQSTDEHFAPSLDARVSTQVRGFDRSGNFSPPSNQQAWIVRSFRLPAPQIVDVTPIANLDLTGLIRIRFRSLPWTNLLGFALYKHTVQPDEPIPADIGELVVRYHDGNLSTTQYQPGQWAPQPGAQPLSELLPVGPPAGADEYLYYDTVKDLYVMQVDVVDREDLVLNLVAIGASGWEGLYEPQRHEGTPNDGLLDWPKFRTDNYATFVLADDLAATYEVSNGRVRLTWTANPEGCTNHLDRPFIVFRRRGGATHWEQLSPMFGCDTASPSPTDMVYNDYDVEPFPDGSPRRHHYTVVRLHTSGEFLVQYGPVFADVP